MKKVLIADKLPQECVQVIEEAGLAVVSRPGLSPQELKKAVAGVHGIVCRSGARITADVLEEAAELEAICRAGVGIDNIDMDAASRRGVVVMNTPGANTISTAEHALALLLGLARNVGPAYVGMREGKWRKKELKGSQLAGMSLGIIGLGRVGRAVAARAAAFDMKCLGYDPYISRDAAGRMGVDLIDDLRELLRDADFLTIHVPENEQTRGMIDEDAIELMKPHARIVNCARGGVVDMQAVLKAVKEGRLAGAAFDVYEQEPPADYSFAQNDAVLATPHLGASTDAAELAVGKQAAEQMVNALLKGVCRNALNITVVPLDEMQQVQPYCALAAKLGATVGQFSCGRPERLEVRCRGDIAEANVQPVVAAAAVGMLRSMTADLVNMVNAPYLAEERGIAITSSTTAGHTAGFANLIELELSTETGHYKVAGTIFGREHPRIINIDGFDVEIVPEGELLLIGGVDKPGLIGNVGELLGSAGINIARMAFGREKAGGKALVALNLDTRCDDATLGKVRGLDSVTYAVRLSLSVTLCSGCPG